MVCFSTHTYCVVPSIHGKEPAAGHGHHRRDGQVGQRVRCHMGYWRIWWKLQHHDHILLHLIFKHEWTLWKETLLNRKGREQKKTEGITQLVKALGRMRLKQMRLVSVSTQRTKQCEPGTARIHRKRRAGTLESLRGDSELLTSSLHLSMAMARLQGDKLAYRYVHMM